MPVPFIPKFVDLVRTTSTTQGTGPLVPGAASPGFSGFGESLIVGDRFYYCAQGVDKPAEREVGRGTLQANGTILREPLSGTATNFTTGSKTISLVTAAEWFRKVEAQGTSTSAVPAGMTTVTTRVDLALLPAIAGAQAALSEGGRAGVFLFDAAASVPRVAADTLQGIYVAPSTDTTGASGAWTRQFSGALDVRWFGALGNFVTDDLPAFKAAHDLIKAGRARSRTLHCEGTFYLSQSLNLNTTMTLRGGGPGFDPTLRSILRFGKNRDGIIINHVTTTGNIGAPEPITAMPVDRASRTFSCGAAALTSTAQAP